MDFVFYYMSKAVLFSILSSSSTSIFIFSTVANQVATRPLRANTSLWYCLLRSTIAHCARYDSFTYIENESQATIALHKNFEAIQFLKWQINRFGTIASVCTPTNIYIYLRYVQLSHQQLLELTKANQQFWNGTVFASDHIFYVKALVNTRKTASDSPPITKSFINTQKYMKWRYNKAEMSGFAVKIVGCGLRFIHKSKLARCNHCWFIW